MRSKRSRSRLISFPRPRFTKSNLFKILALKAQRRPALGKHEYQNLEPRQMLNADIGLNFTSANDGSGVNSGANPPNISAAVGENHLVQFTNDTYAIFQKADGALLETGSIEDFFNATSGPDPGAGITLNTPRLLYDSGFDRWYVVAVDNQDLNANVGGSQANRIWLAASNTADPTGSWKAANFQLDFGTDTSSPRDGTPDVWSDTISNLRFSVDEFAFTISGNQSTFTFPDDDGFPLRGDEGTFTVVLPQTAVFGGAIEGFRAEVAENLDFGVESQFVFDSTIDPQTFPQGPADNTFSLAVEGGRSDQLILSEFTRNGTPNVDIQMALDNQRTITVEPFREPDVVRQPFDIIRDRNASLFNATVVQEGDYIYAVHSIYDQNNVDPDTGIQFDGPNAVLRWYVIDTANPTFDPVTGDEIPLYQGTIDGFDINGTNDIDLINPSIDVSPNGTVAIGYTATGLGQTEIDGVLSTNYPSSYVSLGVPATGVGSQPVFSSPSLLHRGSDVYIDVNNHFWGRYTTTVNDPFDPNNFWTFQQYADASNNWAVRATQVGPLDTELTIDDFPADEGHDIHIDFVPLDSADPNGPGDIVVWIDDAAPADPGDVTGPTGTEVGRFDADGIGNLTVDGTGGMDRFFVWIDDLDSAQLTGIYTLVGDRNDSLFVNSVEDTTWEFDGGYGANINNQIVAEGMVEFHAGEGNDVFDLPTSDYDHQHDVFGGDGNDIFIVGQDVTGQLFLDGEAGDDIYNVPATSLPTNITINDTSGTNDQLVTRGTEGVDDIIVTVPRLTVNGIEVDFDDATNNWGIDAFAVDALGEDDQFSIQTSVSGVFLFGQDGDDTFNVFETAILSGAPELVIDGGAGINALNVFQNDTLAPATVQVSADLITNMTNAPVRFSASDGGIFSIVLTGSNVRSDVFEVLEVESNNSLLVKGEGFDDRFIFENVVDGTARLEGGEGDDMFETNVASIFAVDIDGENEDGEDQLYLAMTDSNDAVVVNENEYIFNGRSYPDTRGMFSNIEDFVIDGLDGDDTFDINRTTTVTRFLGNAGNDTFNVTDLTVTTGEPTIDIDGGADDNTLNVVRNENSGGDVLVNTDSIVGMTIAAINYVATGGIFGLVDLTGSAAADNFVVQTLLGTSLLRIHGQGGDDSMHVMRAPLGNVELFGNVGSDTYRVYVTGDKTRTVTISDPAADAGDDRIEVAFTDGDDNIVVDGTNIGLASDIVVVDPDVETLAVEGLDGDDNFVVVNPVNATVELRGGEGNDTYEIQASGSALNSEIIIIDDGDPSDTDSILVSGTTGADVFDINEGSVFVNGLLLIPATNDNITGVETFTFDGLEGDDTFNINSTTRGFVFQGSEGNDTFNVTDLTATVGSTDLIIDGGTDDNTLNVVRNESTGGNVVVNSDTIVGMTLATINYAATGGVFGLIDLTGSAASDTFVVETLLGTSLLRIDGQDGDDFFSVRRAPLGDIELAGSTGSDTYRVFVTGDKTRGVTITDPAADAGDDRIEVVFTNNDDNILVDGLSLGLNSDLVNVDAEVETLAIEAADGDDLITLVNTQNPTVELLGGTGDDTYNVLAAGNALANSALIISDSVNLENDTLLVTGSASSDIFDINEGSVFVNGNTLIPASNDNIDGVESVIFDGAGSNDTFNINSTTRGFEIRGGDGDDTFNVTDATATTGATAINIDGGAGINELNVVRNEFNGTQVVVNETTVEGMTLATINYTDMSLVDLTGSAAADDFDVQTLLASTLLVIDARAGDDTMTVRREAAGNVDLIGFTGSDNYRVEVQGDKSRLVRVSDPGTITGVDRVEVVFTTGDDVIDVNGRIVGLASDLVDVDPAVETLALEALGGNDVFNVSSPAHANLELYGQAGDDTYVISDLGALASSILISDSVNDENDTLRVLGTVNLDEFIVDDVAITINGVTLTPATGDNIIGVENVSFDGRGDDDIFRINSTTRGFTYLGSEGNDQFFVTDSTVTTGSDSFVIDGGTGNNELFVSRAAILGGAAAGTEIVIEDNRIMGMTIADINYMATDGIFSLIEARGTEGTTAGDDVYDDIFRILTLGDSTLLRVNSLGGDDTIDVRAAAAGDVEMDGGIGDDRFLVALGGNVDRTVTVDDSGVNEGFDRLDVFFSDADETIVVNNVIGDITYAVGNSEVIFDSTFESLALHALGGNDRYVVNGTTTDELILAGGEGDDTYELSNVFGTTSVEVIDSVNRENDRLTVDGTNDADTFIINENSFLINGNPFIVDDINANIVGVESIEVDGLDGDDTFIINSATRGFRLLGGAGNDHFQIHDTAADGGSDDLIIDAGTGVNTMDIQRIAGLPEFTVVQDNYIRNVAKATIRYSATGGSFSGGNGGISITGLDDVNDAFLVFGMLAENSLELLGVGGSDYHRITDNVAGDVWMDAAAGRDRYVFFMDENKVRNLHVADSGTDDSIDRINVFLTQNSDNVVLSGPEVAVFEDRMTFEPTIETIEILAGDGDDDIDLQQFDGVRFLRIKGEQGNDTLRVNGARNVENVFLIGEVGNDTFDLVSASETGYLSANGNEGEDFIRMGEDFYRNGILNGGEDNDRYDVSFADRGTRSVVVADTGATNNDTAIVRATDVSTQLTLRASGINSPNQLIGTTRQIESLELIGTEGADVINMFAAPVANMEINTLTGSDTLNLNSNNGTATLNVDLGAEADVANITATAVGSTTTIDLGRDDDLVNLGSSLAADSGNLDRILGALSFDFGQGSDRLNVNDSQSGGSHRYLLNDNSVSHDTAVSTRGFVGVTYSNAEFLQMQANASFSRVQVTPSATVRYLLDGNLPQANELTITGSDDGRRLFATGDFAGTWTFDSLRDVQFNQFAI